MQTFIKSSYINCDVKSLFDFHIDTNNLQKRLELQKVGSLSHQILDERMVFVIELKG